MIRSSSPQAKTDGDTDGDVRAQQLACFRREPEMIGKIGMYPDDRAMRIGWVLAVLGVLVWASFVPALSTSWEAGSLEDALLRA